MNYLSDIVKVNIELEQPVINSTSFNSLLIVGPEPAINKGIPDFGVYTNITELNELGIKTEGESADVIGSAARVAFSQSPPPAKIYVALQRRLRNIENCSVTLITEDNYKEHLDVEEKPENLPWLMVSSKKIGWLGQNGQGNLEEMITVEIDGEVAEIVNTTETDEKLSFVSLGENDKATIVVDVSRGGENSTSWYCEAVYNNGILDIVDSYYVAQSDEYEDITKTLNRALDHNGWYVICPVFNEYSDYEANLPLIKQWVETKYKICAYPVYSLPAVESKVFRSFGIFVREYDNQVYADIPADNHFMHVAWTARCLNYQAGSETWAMKTMVGMYPATLNSTFKSQLDKFNISHYATYSNRDITLGGKVDGGEWIDVIRFRDWLQNDMQVSIFDLLVRNPKIPYTDGGIAQVKNKMMSSLKKGQDVGGIAPTEFDKNDDEIPGYIVNVPRASEISDADKKSRVLNNCTFRARLAGAIHAVDIYGCLAYSM